MRNKLLILLTVCMVTVSTACSIPGLSTDSRNDGGREKTAASDSVKSGSIFDEDIAGDNVKTDNGDKALIDKDKEKTAKEKTAKEKTSTEIENSDYSVLTEEYVKKNELVDVKITYPQISGLKDAAKQTKINELIKKEVMAQQEDNDTPDNPLTTEISTVVKLKSKDVLSFWCVSYVSYQKAAHPSSVFHAVNVDMTTGELIKINDVIKIDKSLFETILSKGKPAYISGEKLNGDESFLPGVAENLKMNVESSGATMAGEGQFYFTGDALGVAFDVGHAAGDHFEYEIKYKDLKGFIKPGDKIISKIQSGD